ncbi:DUF4150 domain-containing protein [Fulvimarina sp. MAC3]|uniref:DUF4150 domain-containing protein n=1 Tax=Fulvimarina sp. MAC3 TaxID=3148887 RepID=UPI0031FD7787
MFTPADDDQNYAGTVRSNGQIIKKWDSKFTTTYGDEPGVGKGVKSGTVGDVVEPTSHSDNIRVEGQPVIRHSDTCTLNNGNCPGEYIHVKSTEVNAAPDGNDEEDRAWYEKAAGDYWAGFSSTSDAAAAGEGIFNKLSEYASDTSQIGRDAQAAYDSIPTGPEIWQGA